MKTNLQEFIGTLYHNQKVVELLFSSKPHPRFKDELFEADSQLTEDRFRRLLNFQIIQETNHKYFLDERVVDFLSDFLHTGEINTGAVGDILERIKRNLAYYSESLRGDYLQQVKRLLQRLRNTLLALIVRLRGKIDESYKSAQSYELKKMELGYCRQDIAMLNEGIEESKKLLETYKTLLAIDEEMNQLVINLKQSFLQNSTYLFDIQNQIVEYLHKIYQQDEFYKHIHRLKELKDKSAGLHYVSNISQVAHQLHALHLTQYERPKPYVSLHYLYEEEGIKVVKKLREKLHTAYTYTPPAKVVMNTTLGKTSVVEIDKDELFALFARNSRDLFDYLLHFDFSPQFANFDEVQRLNLFVEMVVEYGEQLQFTDHYATLDFTNQLQQNQTLTYQVVLPQ